MKNLSLRVAKIVGTPTSDFWSQVHTFFPEDPKKAKLRGVFLGVLSLSGVGGGVEAVAFGREILTRIQEEYYGELETSAMEKLTQAVSKVSQEFSGGQEKLEIVAGVVLGDVLYLASSGKGGAWVRRENIIQKILGEQEEEGLVDTASGFLKEGDFLVLGTESFFKLLPQGVLRAALENGTPEEAVEVLSPLVHGKGDSLSAAALIVRFQKEQEEEIEAKPSWFRKLPVFRMGDFYIRDRSKDLKRKRMVFTVAIILIILLGTSIFFGKDKRETQDKITKFNLLYSEARQNLEEGKSLVQLNPSASLEAILKAQEKLKEAASLKIEQQKVSDLEKEIESLRKETVKEYRFSELPTFFDLGLLKDKGKGEKLSCSESFLGVLDTEENLLFGIDITRKSGEILAGEENLPGARQVASFQDDIFVLSEKGIVQVGIKNKQSEVKIKSDDGWRQVKAIKVFAGNLYFLEDSGIWRYQKTEDSPPFGGQGFGPRQKWLGTDVKPDLSKAVSMAIDGSIWILFDDGQILKFSQGSPSTFRQNGLDKPFSGASVIYTDQDSENLYILDRGNGRVVVLTKEGQYQAQYIWSASSQGGEGISRVSDMVVSEKEKKILLLDENKIFEIEL